MFTFAYFQINTSKLARSRHHTENRPNWEEEKHAFEDESFLAFNNNKQQYW